MKHFSIPKFYRKIITFSTVHLKKWLESCWLFPIAILAALLVMTSFGVSGSSVGQINKVFFDNNIEDERLLLNQPQELRSDEYSVTTQMALAQKNNGFAEINNNIGGGTDMTLVADAPHNGWSVIFRPHNLLFLVLPFDNAFAFKWWFMPAMLTISIYLLILKIFPRNRLLASVASLAFACSPFFHWWFAYGAFGPVYLSVFGVLSLLKLLESRSIYQTSMWAAITCYVATSFILILYPPFQIPCALIGLAYIIGYLADNKEVRINIKKYQKYFAASSLLLSIAIVGIYIHSKWSAVSALLGSAYPGSRIIESGGFSWLQLLTTNTSPILQAGERYSSFYSSILGSTNQSELSGFLLFAPFLIIPFLYFVLKRKIRPRILTFVLCGTMILLTIWMLFPGVPQIIGRILLIDRMPVSRLIIGVGLLDFILIIFFMKETNKKIYDRFEYSIIFIYCLLVLLAFLLLNFYIAVEYPGYLGYKSAAVLALPLPFILFLLLSGKKTLAMTAFLIFNFGSIYMINPLYSNVSSLEETKISQSIKKVSSQDDRKWIGDENIVENFPLMNGKPSLSGTQLYPQNKLWKDIGAEADEVIYNRYAHVNFSFDRDPNVNILPYFYQEEGHEDQFYIIIEPCDEYLKDKNVGFILTSSKLGDDSGRCTDLLSTVNYPNKTFFIYVLKK